MLQKKAILLFFAIGFLTTGVIAQGSSDSAKLSMWNKGVFTLYNSEGMTSFGPNWMGYTIPQGAYNSITLNWSMKDLSWTMTSEWDGDLKTFPVTWLKNFSGSYTMFKGLIKVTAGKVLSDGGYRFTNSDSTGFSTRIANGDTGILLNVQPIKGLSIGAFLPVEIASTPASTTYSRLNFGIEWVVRKTVTFKASYRMEPITGKGRELAVGAQLTAVPALGLTIGYANYDEVSENDLFLDATYRLGRVNLAAFGYLSLQDASLYEGVKVGAEYSIYKTPFVIGTSVSYGTGDLWWLGDLLINPYVRYAIGSSSLQLGTELTVADTFTYSVKFSYVFGF